MQDNCGAYKGLIYREDINKKVLTRFFCKDFFKTTCGLRLTMNVFLAE